MKINWREHEVITVTILIAIKVAGYVWNMHSLTAEELQVYTSAYNKQSITFHYFSNILLPQAGTILLLYLCYLWVNKFVISLFRTLSFKHITSTFFATTGWIALQLLIVSYVFALGVNIASYYAQPHLLNYGPNFNILAWLGYNDKPLADLFAGFNRAFAIAMLYMVLAGIREGLIYFIEKNEGRRNYRTLISNQFTAVLVIYFSIAAFVFTFDLVDDDLLIGYLTFIPLILLVYMVNMYWLFPSGEDVDAIDFQINSQAAGIINNRLLVRLAVFTLVCTLPFAVLYVKALYQDSFFLVYFGWWAIQLFIVTPLSWVLYRQHKDKIRQLRGVEKELVQSKTHLQFLRSQINPHFLFNVLNTLYGTALLENSERTAEGIQKLGDMMRFMLHENNQDFIPMSREIEYLHNYIALQKLRTQSSPQLSIEDYIDVRHCSHQIAPMLLIPFVENAFKHGISLKEKSWIKIKLICDAQHIHLEVRNSIHPYQKSAPEKDTSGLGLKNVTERLRLLYADRHQFSIQTNAGEYVVQLSIQPKALTSMAAVVT